MALLVPAHARNDAILGRETHISAQNEVRIAVYHAERLLSSLGSLYLSIIDDAAARIPFRGQPRHTRQH